LKLEIRMIKTKQGTAACDFESRACLGLGISDLESQKHRREDV